MTDNNGNKSKWWVWLIVIVLIICNPIGFTIGIGAILSLINIKTLIIVAGVYFLVKYLCNKR